MSAELAGEAADARRQEFEKLAFEHLDALYRTALRMTRNTGDAEDLVQDAYLRAYRFFHRFRPGSSFRAWIFRILRNRFITLYRQRRGRPATVAFDAVACTPDAERFVTRRDMTARARHEEVLVQRLEDALGELPVDSRIPLILAYVEGFRYREIAEIMNWPIGTVMSRLHRSRKKLQRLIEDRPDTVAVPAPVAVLVDGRVRGSTMAEGGS